MENCAGRAAGRSVWLSRVNSLGQNSIDYNRLSTGSDEVPLTATLFILGDLQFRY
jgi:hypothetical protein